MPTMIDPESGQVTQMPYDDAGGGGMMADEGGEEDSANLRDAIRLLQAQIEDDGTDDAEMAELSAIVAKLRQMLAGAQKTRETAMGETPQSRLLKKLSGVGGQAA